MDIWSKAPAAERVHIGFFGRRNSGKSSLINALTGQETAIVSNVPGTTTDPVYKPMEVHGIGPCVLMDTAGFDDEGELGELRIQKTERALLQSDVAVLLFSEKDIRREIDWYQNIKGRNIPVACVISRVDERLDPDERKAMCTAIWKKTGKEPLEVSCFDQPSVDALKENLIRLVPENFGSSSITGSLVKKGDFVLLVMPQDIQAPKGRLILPQVQTIRELLDKQCRIMSVTAEQYEDALSSLKEPPGLIITDSQVFRKVYDKKPEESKLTSFSILFAGYKGDLSYYKEGVKAVEKLTENSRVLIAECCTHAPLSEDIGREKIPALLRKRVGDGLTVDVVSGMDFPDNLAAYDLVIQCGGCMFHRSYVMSRIERAKVQKVPMSNYGVVLAYLTGILDHVVCPDGEEDEVKE